MLLTTRHMPSYSELLCCSHHGPRSRGSVEVCAAAAEQHRNISACTSITGRGNSVSVATLQLSDKINKLAALESLSTSAWKAIITEMEVCVLNRVWSRKLQHNHPVPQQDCAKLMMALNLQQNVLLLPLSYVWQAFCMAAAFGSEGLPGNCHSSAAA